MNLKKYLESRIRGWLPKELTLPRNQRTTMVDQLMRLQLLRLAYGVMLGALLVTPFGVYHSRVEPYIIGSLWGYHLPIGYIGLLLGIAVVLYPRLNTLRSLRFSLFVPLIGLFLLLSFFFSPKYYFINLIHGTSFSSGQIDVDFPVGNSVVLGLSLLSIVFGLVSFIRGWLPKEPTLPRTKRRGLVSEQVKVPAKPDVTMMPYRRFQLNSGIIIGLGIGLILIGFLGWLSINHTYGTLKNFFLASGIDPNTYFLFKDLTNQMAGYLTFMSVGACALLFGALILKSRAAKWLFSSKGTRGRLGGGLMGGGGALTLISTHNLFLCILTLDHLELKFFFAFFIVGVFLVACGILVLRQVNKKISTEPFALKSGGIS